MSRPKRQPYMERPNRVPRVCLTCGDDFEVIPYRAFKGGGKYCSAECHRMSRYRRPVSNGDGTYSIPLTQGRVAIVDADDLHIIEPYTWSIEGGRGRYAIARVNGKHVKMHRLIMGLHPGQFCDHINGDGLDNRRSNLRIATRDQNSRNRKATKGRRFKGVRQLSSGRYRARIAGQSIGTFDTEEEAAAAYNAAASDMFGEFARLNPVSRRNS